MSGKLYFHTGMTALIPGVTEIAVLSTAWLVTHWQSMKDSYWLQAMKALPIGNGGSFTQAAGHHGAVVRWSFLLVPAF